MRTAAWFAVKNSFSVDRGAPTLRTRVTRRVGMDGEERRDPTNLAASGNGDATGDACLSPRASSSRAEPFYFFC